VCAGLSEDSEEREYRNGEQDWKPDALLPRQFDFWVDRRRGRWGRIRHGATC
jgi:hypothetical protein